MTKKNEFIAMVDSLIDGLEQEEREDFEVAIEYFEKFKTSTIGEEKPQFTDNGIIILDALQKLDGNELQDSFLAKEIADQSGMNSRSISGSIRKLVTDGYVEIVSREPNSYTITDKGREVDIQGR